VAGSEIARTLLGVVRLVNGTAALVAPERVAERLGVDPSNPALLYALRMFGIRNVLIGGELLVGDERVRARAVRVAPVVHVSDTVAAALAAVSGRLPRRAAVLITCISAANTALALLAQRER
jgi:hypothetical protein